MAGEAHEGGGFNIHPMDQFRVHPLFGGDAVHWYTPTNATLWMLLTVLAINLMGDGLRDALDPKLKRS